MFGLNGFSWAAMWSPWAILSFAAVAVLYLYITGPGRKFFPSSEPVPVLKKAWFVSGVFFLYVAFGSPIDLLGHLMFTFHMLGMAFAYIIATPMLLAGTPGWLLEPIARIPGIKHAKWLMKPIVTILLFNAAFSVYHIPVVHDYVMTHYTVHTLYYILLMITSLLMWFPIICPIKSMDRLEGFKKMGYIFADSVLLMPACALIIFSGTAMYSTYTDPKLWAIAMGYCLPQNSTIILDMFQGPGLLQWMDPLEDQQTGGVVMKLIQEVVYGSILIYVFLQWYRKENPKDSDLSHEPSEAVLEQLRRSASEPLPTK
ncbi:cytochrome c oxidase assembly factor CtaG [Paenibacillus thermotolerans]|uniref:cytochrome c oxidase assembly factor CtaG n=1 Tax=Paenibacillus thermotolerans TaxID=3027807 RepID=UPI002367C151|nr:MULTISPECIES: cytochrome c oxidase assembly factor CtaG [unclassified Paenibacillus]